MAGNDMTLVYGFLIGMGIFVLVWILLVAPSERRDHERRLALVQKRIAEREQRHAHDSDTGRVILRTSRLLLRELTETDAAFMLRLLNDEAFLHFIGDRGVRTNDAARNYLREGAIASYRDHGFGMYRVVRTDDGASIGVCGLVRRDGLDAPDLGFALLPAYRRGGYAAEAAAAVLQYARDTLELSRVVAIAQPDNSASIALLEGIGMRLEGRTFLPDGETELNLYAAGRDTGAA